MGVLAGSTGDREMDRRACVRPSGTAVTEVVGRLAGTDSPVKLIGAGRADPRRPDRRPRAGRAGRRRRDWARPGTGQAAHAGASPLIDPSPPGSRSFPVRRTVRGSASPPASSRSTTSGTPATTPPSRPTTRENERSRPTGTASPIAASPTPATPPTGFAGSANIPIFKPLAEEARPLLDEHGDSQLAGRLMSGGAWNATAMIDLCTQARPGTPERDAGCAGFSAWRCGSCSRRLMRRSPVSPRSDRLPAMLESRV